MNKIVLDTFIQKYNLGGNVNSVKWESSGDTLSTRFISPDKSLLGELTLTKQALPKFEVGVYDTPLLSKMLGTLSDSIDFKLVEVDNTPVAFHLTDSVISADYVLAAIGVIPDVPELDMSSTAPEVSEPDPVADYETIQEVREIVSDLFYKFWFESNTLTDEQVLSLQTTIRDGKKQTGRAESEPLVFYKKDRNTLENRQDLQGESFESICNDIFNNEIPNSIIPTLFSFEPPTTEPYSSGEELPINTTQEIRRKVVPHSKSQRRTGKSSEIYQKLSKRNW